MNNVTLPGQGVKLKDERHREMLFVALYKKHRGNLELTKDTYYRWTGYFPKGDWSDNLPKPDRNLEGLFNSFVYTVYACEIELQDLQYLLQNR